MIPKKFNNRTTFDENGYPRYQKTNNGGIVDKNGIILDNRFTVPYNQRLLLKYQTHINIEFCN